MNCTIVLAFVSRTDSMINFPAASRTATEIVAVCTSIPMYLVLFTRALLSERIAKALKTYYNKGAPLYLCRNISQHGARRAIFSKAHGPQDQGRLIKPRSRRTEKRGA